MVMQATLPRAIQGYGQETSLPSQLQAQISVHVMHLLQASGSQPGSCPQKQAAGLQ